MRSVMTFPTTCTELSKALAGTCDLATFLVETAVLSITLMGGRSRAASRTSTIGSPVLTAADADAPDREVTAAISTAAHAAATTPNRTKVMTATFMRSAPDLRAPVAPNYGVVGGPSLAMVPRP